jgi:hypothetical protein
LGEVWWRGFRAAYLIDMTTHQEAAECELPTAQADLNVWAAVRYSWRVCDPVQVVLGRAWDAPAACSRELAARLSAVSRHLPPADLVRRAPAVAYEGIAVEGLDLTVQSCRISAQPPVPEERHEEPDGEATGSNAE